MGALFTVEDFAGAVFFRGAALPVAELAVAAFAVAFALGTAGFAVVVVV